MRATVVLLLFAVAVLAAARPYKYRGYSNRYENEESSDTETGITGYSESYSDSESDDSEREESDDESEYSEREESDTDTESDDSESEESDTDDDSETEESDTDSDSDDSESEESDTDSSSDDSESEESDTDSDSDDSESEESDTDDSDTIIDCGRPPAPRYGFVRTSGTRVGCFAKHFCFRGFRLVGNFIRICQRNGHWSGRKPVCRKMYY